jgi:hypothetical protein
MPRHDTKSRQTSYGGPIMGAPHRMRSRRLDSHFLLGKEEGVAPV